MPHPNAPQRYTKPVGPMTEAQARQHVGKLKEFYWHLTSFLIVMPLLIGLNLFTSPGHLWFIYALLGWGFGLMGHASEVVGMPGLGSKWEERKMQELMGTRRDDEAASIERLRALVTEAVGEEETRRSEAARQQDVSTERLLRRIEHLEAIVTSRDWDLVEADYRQSAPPRLDLDTLPEPEGATGAPPSREAQAAYLARRVH